MKKILMVTAPFLMSAGLVWAEIVSFESKLNEVNEIGSYLKVFYLNPQTEENEEITVHVTPATRFKGVASLAELNDGDEVLLEANFDKFSHEWTAQRVSAVEGVKAS